ncbi:MAG: efflux RND transporter periplasmic adaptor subunit [Terriglobia bacterium]|nr:MAG: efflux RND transporter periplasmic adaptor subunit [Terriglobia bacterium]
MKGILVVLVIGAAYAGGYGYGRWYAKPRVAGPAEKKVLYWVDSMHPWYKSDKPGIAPDCGMKLAPVYEGQEEGSRSTLPPGAIEITPEKQQLIGVEYGTVAYENVRDSVRAAARVTFDETKIDHVHSRLDGWIDQVFADFTGKYVRRGEPLVTVYSPEAVATQQEYLLAMKAAQLMHDNPVHEMAGSTENLVSAARKRLEFWDINEAQIEQIARTGQTIKNLTVEAPISGFITERNAFPKQRVTPETTLYTVADLSTVWVIADVFEYEAANVRPNQPAALTLEYLPGRVFHGRVSYILPQVDPNTRTLKVRLQFDNPDYLLKPDMYGQVELQTGGARKLVVPQSAVLNSGEKQVVFVDLGTGYFEPRTVQIGQQQGDRIEIVSGLKAGERIVTSGNFLIDSESQLKAAINGASHDPSHH